MANRRVKAFEIANYFIKNDPHKTKEKGKNMEDKNINLSEFARGTDLDYSNALMRFSNNEALLKKFIKRLPEDKSFQELSDAIENKDYKKVELKAQILKGVSANLGFLKLSQCCGGIVESCRRGNYESIEPQFEEVEKLYGNIISNIKLLD